MPITLYFGVLNVFFCLIGTGNYVQLVKTASKPGSKATLMTDFRDTTDQCLELFYNIQSDGDDDNDKAALNITVINENLLEITLVSRSKTTLTNWNYMRVELPNGIHQILIEAQRSEKYETGFSLDDITIHKCSHFGKLGIALYALITITTLLLVIDLMKFVLPI